MDKMTDSRAADVLAAHNEWRRYDGFSGEPGAPAAQHPTEIGLAIDHAIARLRESAEAQGTPIADLLADYEANGCDHTDMAWVRAAARRYAKTMPDSQARCLLHVLAQEPAEAQAQGGAGRAGCGGGR